MVEMVFVLPVLLMLVYAIGWFGVMFSRSLTLSNAVHEGARAGAVYRSPCVESAVVTDATNAVKGYVQAAGIAPSEVVVVVRNACAGRGSPLEVEGTLAFDVAIPFASVNLGPLAYTSTMRNESD